MRNSHLCGICDICFMSETQVLMAVSDFLNVFFLLRIISWKGTSLFNKEFCFSAGEASVLSGRVPHGGRGIRFDGGVFKKKIIEWGRCPHATSPLGETAGVEIRFSCLNSHFLVLDINDIKIDLLQLGVFGGTVSPTGSSSSYTSFKVFDRHEIYHLSFFLA